MTGALQLISPLAYQLLNAWSLIPITSKLEHMNSDEKGKPNG